MAVEIWTNGGGLPKAFARRAATMERAGYDGIMVGDTQNLSGDCYVALAVASTVTERLKLGVGVTNPYTRHPAVTACAIASIQGESGGRAVLGVGRGDSALAYLGHAPTSLPVFEAYLSKVQGYLRGEDVPLDAGGDVEALQLGDRPTASRLTWLRPSQPKVPVEVAATGPKVIALAARGADRVTFALGADPARVRWGIETARRARIAAGLSPDMPFASYVNVVVSDDVAEARELGTGGMASVARFSVIHGSVVGPADEHQKEVFTAVHANYDMNHHGGAGSKQSEVLDDTFTDRFGVFGPPAHCIARLRELIDLGLDRLIVFGPSSGTARDAAERALQRFHEEVMPALR